MAAKAKIGDLVEVAWLDASGAVNGALAKAGPSPAVNVGWLTKEEPDYIVLVTGRYTEEKEDRTVDWTALPLGMIERITVIKRGV